MLRAEQRRRVNPLAPGAVMAAGVVAVGLGYRFIGAGILVGAVLAYMNGLFLSRRVDLAADTGNMAGALMVMQVGFLLSMLVIGVATIVLVKISIAMAVACAAGFAVAQMAILAAFYWARGRTDPQMEGKPS